MASVFDVAKYILKESGEMSAMKLQKLVYYSQAWSLVWDDEPLFAESIEAWANGPVCPALYEKHKGFFKVAVIPGLITQIKPAQRETIDAVLKKYGNKSAFYLSALTHSEAPWKNAREGMAPGERGNNTITKAAMAEYYGSLYKS